MNYSRAVHQSSSSVQINEPDAAGHDRPIEEDTLMDNTKPTFLAPKGDMWRNTCPELDRLAHLESIVLAGTATDDEIAEFRERRDAHEAWMLATYGDALNDETIRVFIATCSPAGLRDYRLTRIDLVWRNTRTELRIRYAEAGESADTGGPAWDAYLAALTAAGEAKTAAITAVNQECEYGQRFLADVYSLILKLSPATVQG